MLYDEKSIVSRLALGSTVCHIRLQRNASIHQGRLPSEEVMVKTIMWEVKIRVECNTYCNSVQKRRICCLWGDILCVIGFKLGVHKRNQHDMVKKEKMDRIFKYKCCIAFLLGCKTSKYDGVLKNAQNQLEILGLCIQDLEGGQEYLFRRLIERRFSILQYLNHESSNLCRLYFHNLCCNSLYSNYIFVSLNFFKNAVSWHISFSFCQETAFFLDGTKSNALYVIVASNCHKFDAIRWYLQLLQDSFCIARGTFFVMSQDCLLSIQSAWNCMR